MFGPGVVAELPKMALAYGRRAFVVTGKDRIRRAGIIAELEGAGFHCTLYGVAGEPTVTVAVDGGAAARLAGSNVVIAIGGGSVIDAGKAIAAFATNEGDPLEFLEVIGRGRPLRAAPLPFIAVPTTAGTGSEVTRNAVLGSPEHGVKVSLRSASMLPAIALIDPVLTLTLPPDLSASTGLDTLTQLIEPFVSIRANPLTDAICREGIPIAARCLPAVCRNGRDAESRAGMSYASVLGGMALANAGLGVVHGFAAPIGGMFDAPHGAVCAAILPHGVAANVAALRERDPESEALVRYAEVARILTGDTTAEAEACAAWLKALVKDLQVPGLSRYGISLADSDAVVSKASKASSMKANPLPLTDDELASVFAASLE
ncbi:MAG: iron-containing alcohol dehydrogenase [Bryobacterales bacterium]|nr:iron-containing alcohol dehydrogenase [Bryobacterales bacterium]